MRWRRAGADAGPPAECGLTFVSCPDGVVGASMAELDERWREDFAHGVSAVLQKWEALRMAVDQEFGGPHSREKGAWLEDVTAQWFFENGKSPCFEL